jgi:hypothetical protein
METNDIIEAALSLVVVLMAYHQGWRDGKNSGFKDGVKHVLKLDLLDGYHVVIQTETAVTLLCVLKGQYTKDTSSEQEELREALRRNNDKRF